MYAFIPDEMQPAEVCRPFVERFAAAISDHGTLDLLTADGPAPTTSAVR
jgi:hypothetical protein